MQIQKLAPIVLLLLRANLGVLFMSTGWGKVHDLASVTSFFTELGIPLPGVNAAFVSYLELIGGALLVLGLATRFIAAPLAFTMLIAIVTAKAADIHGIADLASTDELTYMLVLLTLAVLGAGAISLDALVGKRLSARQQRDGQPLQSAAQPL
jgi:putative oxidoreductase